MSVDDKVSPAEMVTFLAMQRASRDLFGSDWTEMMLACQLGKLSLADLAKSLRMIQEYMRDDKMH